MLRSVRYFVVVAAGILVLAACTSNGSDEEPGSGQPSVEDILEDSSEAMADVETVRFTIEQTGAELYIDDDELIRFGGAVGRYSAPSSADALLSVSAFGLSTEVGAVAIDGEIWITNPLTGDWEDAPADFTFDPTVLFSDTDGWSVLLTEGLEDPTLVADDESGYQVRATIAADRVEVLTGGLVNEASQIDIWIDRRSGRVTEVAFDVGEGDGLTSWRLALSDYGADVTITRPDVGPDR